MNGYHTVVVIPCMYHFCAVGILQCV